MDKVEIPDFEDDGPTYQLSEVVGFASSGRCSKHDFTTLKLNDVHPVNKEFRITANNDDNISWYLTEEVEIDAPFRFTDSDIPIKAKVVESSVADHGFLSTRKKDFSTDRAALIMAAVDRHVLSLNNITTKRIYPVPRKKTIK